MTQLVEMKLSSGASIFVEVSDAPGVSGAAPPSGEVMRGGEAVLARAGQAFDQALQNVIVQNSLLLVTAFKEMENHPIPPSKATAEFGLKFNGKGNIYVVESSAEASFKITLEWLPNAIR